MLWDKHILLVILPDILNKLGTIKPKIFLHEKGYFIVKFANLDDRNEILYSGPHMIDSRPMIIKAWILILISKLKY